MDEPQEDFRQALRRALVKLLEEVDAEPFVLQGVSLHATRELGVRCATTTNAGVREDIA